MTSTGSENQPSKGASLGENLVVNQPAQEVIDLDIENKGPEAASDGKDDSLSLCARFTSAFRSFLLPRLTPTPPGTFVVLFVSAAIPCLLYIIPFTKMGYGLTTFYYISENYEQYGTYLGASIGGGAFLLYLFDCYYWDSSPGVFLRKLFIGLLLIAIALFSLCMAGIYPHGPISLFIILVAFWMILTRSLLFSDIEPRVYISWLSGPLFLEAVLIFACWITWTLYQDANEWNFIISISDAQSSGCEPNFVDYPDCQNDDGEVCFEVDIDAMTYYGDNCDTVCKAVFSDCSNGFIIWVGPFLVSLALIFLSVFATFLRKGSSPEQESAKFVQIWLFLLFAMWVGASLSGAGAGVSTTLAAFTLSSFIAAAIFLAISFKKIERTEQLQKIGDALVDKYGNHFDIFRGLLVVTCTPVFLFYFFISFVIQRIRSISGCYTKPPSDTMSLKNVVASGWFTVEARRLIREFQSWNRTKVLTYAVYWGLAFMVLNVIVSQFTLVFLSWLIEKTSSMPLPLVTGVLVGIGMTMFLLPPVPGVPIYLTLGIVIIPVGRDTFGVFGSTLYALGVSLCLKLLACTLQQKLIGGLLQSKVGVRQFCGVNSSLMRSMKLVLKQPGLGIDKVSILVGGPDWPTSVLCGIMDLDLIPILIGTLPIIFLITPTLLTGSFMYMSSVTLDNGEPEFPWAGTMTTVFTAITAFVQFGSMAVAAFYLEQTVSNRQEDLEAIPIDEEVKARDEADEAITTKFDELTEWSVLPVLAKVVLSSSVTVMIISCYLVQLFASDCFMDYELTSTIDEHLNGDWKNLVKPLGIVANILLVASVLLLYLFRQWAMSMARKQLQRGHSGTIHPSTDYMLHS